MEDIKICYKDSHNKIKEFARVHRRIDYVFCNQGANWLSDRRG